MTLPSNYIVEHRNVKHARLRVHEDGSVRLYVPQDFTEHEISKILEMKASWIESKQQYFRQKGKILLRRNELLLLGNRYAYFYSSQYKNKVVVYEDSKTIQARRNLLDMNTQEKWLKSIAKKYIYLRVSELSENLMLPFNRLFLRSQKRKWGNCSADKNISINWRIIKAPVFVIDYVIIHELCHTLIMKHTLKFETLLNSYYPNYKQAQAWLEKYGNSL
jgi:hypothetical protein